MESQRWSCAVCLDGFFLVVDHPICLDDDKICEQCLYRLFELALTGEAHYPSRWGAKIIHPTEYENIVGSELVETYKAKEREWKTTAAYRIYCSCGRFMGSKSYWPTIWCHTCVRCDTVACSSCRLIIGKRHDCEHHKCHNQRMLQIGELDEAFEALVRGKDYQICPNTRCQRRVEHTEGCNHMVCQPGCGTHFCYRCGKESDLDSYHWSQGSCPLYTASSDIFAQYQEPVAREERMAAEQARQTASHSPSNDMDYGWGFQVWAWNAAMQTRMAFRQQWMLLHGRSTDADRRMIHEVMHAHNEASHGVPLDRWTQFSKRYSEMTLPWLAELDAAIKRNELLPTGLLQRPVHHLINVLTVEGKKRLRSWAGKVAERDDYEPVEVLEGKLRKRRDTDQRRPHALNMLNVYPGDIWMGMGPHENDEEALKGVRMLENLLRERMFDTRVVKDNFGLYMRTCSAIRNEDQATAKFQPPFNTYEVLDWTATDVFNPDKPITMSEDGFVRPRRLQEAIDFVPAGSLKMEPWGRRIKPPKMYKKLPGLDWVLTQGPW